MRIRDLLAALEFKTFGSATGLEPPNLHAMLSNAGFALKHPGSYTEVYVEFFRRDIEEAQKCLAAIEQTLPTLEKRTAKRWKKRKKK